MDYRVVYWPRHLWMSASTTASLSTVFCRRLSPTSVCVVSLDATPSSDLELLTAKGSESCRVILFDTEVAAIGSDDTRYIPKPLRQMEKYFQSCNNCDKIAATSSKRAKWNVLQTLGFYVLHVPIATLLTMTTALKQIIHETKTPSWLITGGGKNLSELSTFLSVLSLQGHNAAHIVNRLEHLYRKKGRLSRQEKRELLQICNFICFFLLDVALGRMLLAYVITTPFLQAFDTCPKLVVDFLRSNVEWLMGAPAGFKLNKPLATILGNGILLWLHLWNFLSEQLVDVAKSIHLGWWLLQITHFLGLTLQLTLLADIVSLTTWHSHWVYLYFAKLNRVQFQLFSSLSKLFCGRKNNVLRQRVDTCEYDIGQLLLGTLIFTILTFLVTTNLVFFAFFAVVRGSIKMILLLLWLPVVALNSLPVASLIYRAWNPFFFVVGMELQTFDCMPDNEIVFRNVGVGRQSPRLDAQHKSALRQVFASRENSNISNCDNAIFQLVPITSSYTEQFIRLRTYLQAEALELIKSRRVSCWATLNHQIEAMKNPVPNNM
ncbi:putative N-acetylglucosaminyl transferase component [Plasmopara halstedii]